MPYCKYKYIFIVAMVRSRLKISFTWNRVFSSLSVALRKSVNVDEKYLKLKEIIVIKNNQISMGYCLVTVLDRNVVSFYHYRWKRLYIGATYHYFDRNCITCTWIYRMLNPSKTLSMQAMKERLVTWYLS